jgi:Cu+-exporting ATPase
MVNKETQYITAYEEDSSSIYWAGRYLKLVELQKALFRVVGMYCSTCKPIVERQLKGEQAIKNIDIDFMTDSVIVEYDSKLLTKEKIREKLEKSGYKFVRVAT